MAAQNFGEFALKLNPRDVQDELLTSFHQLAVDQQVRSPLYPTNLFIRILFGFKLSQFAYLWLKFCPQN